MSVDLDCDPRESPIRPQERTGVLAPDNLTRYHAHWVTPDPAVADVVDQYWHVSWNLGDRSIDQRIIDAPAVTLTVEEGDVPAPLMITGVQARAWHRTIHRHGRVFAVRLRPAGLAVLGALSPQRLANTTLPLTEELDAGLHALMRRVAAHPTPQARTQAADEAIRARLADRPLSEGGLLANRVVDELRSRLHRRTGDSLPAALHVSERTIQRCLRATLGRGPRWVGHRIRLQEVVLALTARPDADLATIAADFGFADQSHLAGAFRAACGMSPSAYRRSLEVLING